MSPQAVTFITMGSDIELAQQPADDEEKALFERAHALGMTPERKAQLESVVNIEKRRKGVENEIRQLLADLVTQPRPQVDYNDCEKVQKDFDAAMAIGLYVAGDLELHDISVRSCYY